MKRITIMVLVGLITLVIKAQSVDASESKSIKDLEATYDTTIGVYGINTQDGKQIEHRANERFCFCFDLQGYCKWHIIESTFTTRFESKGNN
ncbi:beta-lactamase precursor [Staphylococcus gallinarum]|uniref:Beta-lactamase n=1 Tax=Staphylococcus gallinarum TaxID=1293 RepID=A0A380FDD3_STAGA|nr:beta-lactamase precursor [Staphylococcus gallinarum]